RRHRESHFPEPCSHSAAGTDLSKGFASVFVTAQDGLTLHVRRYGSGHACAHSIVCLPGLARTVTSPLGHLAHFQPLKGLMSQAPGRASRRRAREARRGLRLAGPLPRRRPRTASIPSSRNGEVSATPRAWSRSGTELRRRCRNLRCTKPRGTSPGYGYL